MIYRPDQESHEKQPLEKCRLLLTWAERREDAGGVGGVKGFQRSCALAKKKRIYTSVNRLTVYSEEKEVLLLDNSGYRTGCICDQKLKKKEIVTF